MDITTRLHLLDLVRQAQQATSAHTAAVRAAGRAAKAAAQARARVDDLAQQRPAAQNPGQASAAPDELDEALEEHTGCLHRLQAANRKVARTFLAARAANRTLGATYAQHARGRARAASRDEVAAGLLDELADVPLGLMDAAHAILVQSSAGKDSLVQLHRIATWAEKAGCLHKVIVIHIDLGEESEWPGVRELAQRQAERYGLRFHVLRAEGGLLGLVEKRGMWPDAARRLCTATLKRDVANKLLRQIAAELGLDEQAVILNCMGIRAAESPARSKKQRLAIDMRTSANSRMVLTWHPIFEVTDREVWQEIATHGLEYHPVYDALIPRLSCVFCVLAPFDVLVRAARLCWALGLPLPARYRDLEAKIGHRFKQSHSLAEVYAEAERLEREEGPLVWNRGDAVRQHLGAGAADDYLARVALAA
jgi:3'-phosphoadenosine 5'-phosphosulfate sulfotransferase (PAPS reductase)/FAD synthetase